MQNTITMLNDLHSHIIYSVDDGARTINESFQILKKAHEANIKKIALTPHYISGDKNSVNDETNLKYYNELTKLVALHDLNIELYLGQEVYLTEDIIDLYKNKQISTINNSRYMLVELPINAYLPNAHEILGNLINAGITPIIAHPERYKYDYDFDGYLLQGNYKSLFGKYGKNAKAKLEEYLKTGKITCLASDTHRGSDEYDLKQLPKQFKKLKLKQDYIENIMLHNADKIINNQDISK